MTTTPTISPVLRYQDAAAAIDFLAAAFGFERHSDHARPMAWWRTPICAAVQAPSA